MNLYSWKRAAFAVALFWGTASVRAQTPGSVDSTFQGIVAQAPGVIYHSVAQPDGKVLIGGSFNSINSTAYSGLVRLNADGSVDTGFSTNNQTISYVESLALQTDGKVLVGGSGYSNSVYFDGIARLNADGTLDSSFNSSGVANSDVAAIAIQSDGKIVIGGYVAQANGYQVLRLNADGSVDAVFSPGSGAAISDPKSYTEISAVAVQPDGKVLVVGHFDSFDGVARTHVARLNTDGSLDTAFNPVVTFTGTYISVDSVAAQSDSKVIIGGYFTAINGVTRNYVARLNSDGALDTGFDPGSNAFLAPQSVVVLTGGKILAAGSGSIYDSSTGFYVEGIARLNSDGSYDTSFNPGSGSDNYAFIVSAQASGSMLIGGYFRHVNGVARTGVAILNSDGSLVTGFDPDIRQDSAVRVISVQSDGKALIGGGFTLINNVARTGIARLNADGSLDPGFDPVFDAFASVSAIVVQPDAKLLIGGYFGSVNGTGRSCIARTNADGTLDSGFNPGSGASGTPTTPATIESVVLQTDGEILIGGDFSSFNGMTRNQVARLNANGNLDTGFDPGSGAGVSDPNGNALEVQAMAVQSDKKVLIGGYFNSFGGMTRTSIARLNVDGTVDAAFDPSIGATGTYNSVLSIAVQSDGKAMIGGNFSSVGGAPHEGIARLNPDGSLDAGFDTYSNSYLSVQSIALQPDGKVLFGGSGSIYDPYVPASIDNVGRLNLDGSIDTVFATGSGANSNVNSIALRADGKLLAAGGFSSFNGVAQNQVALLDGGDAPPPSGPPAISNAGSLLVFTGSPFSLRINATNSPTTYSASPLPAGLALHRSLISGTPTVAGAYGLTVTASNALGTGSATIALDVYDPPSPSTNDNFSDALILTGDSGMVLGNNTEATSQNGEPNPAGLNGGHSLWYAWTPSLTGPATINTFDSTFDTILGVYTGQQLPNLTLVAANDDSGSGFTSSVNFETQAGTTYYIDVNGNNSASSGDVVLRYSATGFAPTPTPTPIPPPAAVSVTLTSPADGASFVSGTDLPLTATIGDSAGIISKVDFYLGSTLVSEIGPNASYFFNTVAPAPGTYIVSVVSTDTLGRQSTSAHTIQVVAGANVGSATITTDTAGRLFASASDLALSAIFNPPAGDPISEVTFSADGVVFATFDGAGNPLPAGSRGKHLLDSSTAAQTVYKATFHLPGADKLLTILAQALTAAGHTVSAAPVGVHAVATKDQPPQATIGGIASGSRLRTAKMFSAPVTVTDPDAPAAAAVGKRPRPRDYTVPSGVISKIEYYLDAIKMGEAAGSPYTFNFTLPAEGVHVLTVVATDGAGIANASAPVQVNAFVAPSISVAVKGGDDVSEAGGSGKFVLKRDGTDFSQPVTVAYKLKGTAKNGVDYQTAPSTEVIPAGASSVKLKIKPMDEMITGGGTRTVNLKLLASPNDYDIGSPKKATISILDND